MKNKIFKVGSTIALAGMLAFSGCSCNKDELPKAVAGDNDAGKQFGVDANINVTTIDNYLFRTDSVYRDMRLLIDPYEYEKIGGDRYLSGYVEGFEITPLPYILNLNEPALGALPPKEATGEANYEGHTYGYSVGEQTLFTYDATTGEYKETFEGVSLQVLESLFPKDKYIFLMCGGGGYAGITKNMLIALGWDGEKIYNVGGYWGYEGNHNVVLKVTKNNITSYNFYKAAYHDLLTYINEQGA